MLYTFAGIFLFGFVIFLYNSVQFRKNERKRVDELIRSRYGAKGKEVLTEEDIHRISYYYLHRTGSGFTIDDITYNDLDMNQIFAMLNNTYSSVGEEYLYQKLRTPVFDSDFRDDENAYRYFEENPEEAIELQKIFYQIGKNKNHSIYELIEKFRDVKKAGNILHYLCILLFAVSFSLLFIEPVIGIFAFFGVLMFNIGSYYRYKGKVDEYFVCFRYLTDMIFYSEKILKLHSAGIQKENEQMESHLKQLKAVKKGEFLIGTKGNTGSIAEILMDYVRMIFHVDIIKFNHMADTIVEYNDSIYELYEALGNIESILAVASFRKSLEYYAIPVFTGELKVDAQELYHPLIEHPVSNSICEKKSVLLTGSNASGKSTFLKSVAVNLIFAQTIHTCTAKAFSFKKCRVYSSMALRDNIMNNESYFMVEIKSLKRIVDALRGEIPVICFVDEVLRGTNTVERIAASSHILKHIARQHALCFAATHDIELTEVLEEYSNYHFTEQLKDKDVCFDYVLHSGKATSKNAIMLLSSFGFDDSIVESAKQMADYFVEEGIWKMNLS